MAVKLNLTTRNAMAQAIISNINGGSTLYIMTGEPSSCLPGTYFNQFENVLSQHILGNPIGNATNGVITFSQISEDTNADRTGEATFATIVSSNYNAAQMSVSGIGGGGDLQMNTTSVVKDGPVRFTSLTWTMPGA